MFFLLMEGTNVFMSYFSNWAAAQVSLSITVGGYIAIKNRYSEARN